MEPTNKKTKIKIITNSGYKYSGILIEKGEKFVKLNDEREGPIEIPLLNISFLKELGDL